MKIPTRSTVVEILQARYGSRPPEEVLIWPDTRIKCPTLMLIGKNKTNENYSIKFDNVDTFTWHNLINPRKDFSTTNFDTILTAIDEVLL